MRGRKPIPNAIKRKLGNGRVDSGGRRIPDEPQPPPGAPPMPRSLDGRAKQAWIMFTSELAAMDLLTRADAAALQILCETWAQLQEAAENLQTTGIVIKWPNGQPGASPYFKTYHDAAKLVKAMLAEFGLTPSSRSRFAMPLKDQEEEDDLVKALDKKGGA